MVGFNNLGNTCYLNSILQCLIATEPLVNYFLGDDFVDECRNTLVEKIKKEKNMNDDCDGTTIISLNKNEINKILKSYVCIHLYEIIKHAYNNDNEKIISPSHFYNLIGKKHDIFSGNEQNDSHEILNYILHDINDEIKTKTNFLDDIQISNSFQTFIETKNDFDNMFKCFNEMKKSQKIQNDNRCNIKNINDTKNIYYQYIKNNNYFVTLYNSHVYLKKYFHNNYSPIYKIFLGLFFSSIVCLNCDKSKITYEPFLSISLSITNDTKSQNDTSLESCLEYFLKKEYLSNNNKYKCDNCNEYTNANKKMYILKKPDILIFHLKRFNQENDTITKNKHLVYFPINNLIIKNNFLEENNDMDINDEKKEMNYNLYAIICHLGAIDSGHYISFCKNIQNNKWYLYDDNDVKEIDINVLHKNNIMKTVVLLFYQLIA